jgi:hypothetical protein
MGIAALNPSYGFGSRLDADAEINRFDTAFRKH